MGGVSVGPRWNGTARAGAWSVTQRDHHAAAHSSGFKHLKSFYHGFAEPLATFPACRATSTSSACRKASSCRWWSSSSATWGAKPGSLTSTPPPCDNHRISRHKVFAGLAHRGKTSMGWFFGFKLHLVFNNCHEIVALKLTPGNVHDTQPVPALTRELTGKLFGDKGSIGRKLAEDLLRRGLTLFTRVRRNMKGCPYLCRIKP